MEALPVTHFSGSMGDGHVAKGRPPRHPFMHRTKSIDYAIVLEGEIDMLLDDCEVHLRPATCWFSKPPTTPGSIAARRRAASVSC